MPTIHIKMDLTPLNAYVCTNKDDLDRMVPGFC